MKKRVSEIEFYVGIRVPSIFNGDMTDIYSNENAFKSYLLAFITEWGNIILTQEKASFFHPQGAWVARYDSKFRRAREKSVNSISNLYDKPKKGIPVMGSFDRHGNTI